ncbi:hypothetical protein SAMN05661096_01089 [Marivirga sericea]|uniref:Uncharacterized protein n=1 Tax=Marivirga sericea TaxID=1028 RepID=A0A1X7IYZ5_9BACT|nr:hypothetical protein SAMN05661096_01089 [Marivirga sericea]
MKSDNAKKEKPTFIKGLVAVLILAFALFGFYQLILDFLKFLGTI